MSNFRSMSCVHALNSRICCVIVLMEGGVLLVCCASSLSRLYDAATAARIELSRVQQAHVNLPYITADQTGPKHLDVAISRARMDILVEPLLKKVSMSMSMSMTSPTDWSWRRAHGSNGFRSLLLYHHRSVLLRPGFMMIHDAILHLDQAPRSRRIELLDSWAACLEACRETIVPYDRTAFA